MNLLVVIIVCVIAISIGVIAVLRTRLKNKSKELAEKLSYISSYSYEQARERLSALNDGVFIDIPSDLNNGFYGKVISETQENDFISY